MQILNVKFQCRVTPTFLNFGWFWVPFYHIIFHLIFNHNSDTESFRYQEGEEGRNPHWNPTDLKPGTFSREVQHHSPTPPGPQIYYKQDKRTLELRVYCTTLDAILNKTA